MRHNESCSTSVNFVFLISPHIFMCYHIFLTKDKINIKIQRNNNILCIHVVYIMYTIIIRNYIKTSLSNNDNKINRKRF